MSITMTAEELNRIRKTNDIHVCLDKSDVESLQEIAAKMTSHRSDDDILRLARRVLRAERRNDKAKGNQHNIDLLVNAIMEQTKSGDIINFSTCYKLLREYRVNNDYATDNALIMALAQLTKSGYLTEEIVRYDSGYSTYYKKIYTVV